MHTVCVSSIIAHLPFSSVCLFVFFFSFLISLKSQSKTQTITVFFSCSKAKQLMMMIIIIIIYIFSIMKCQMVTFSNQTLFLDSIIRICCVLYFARAIPFQLCVKLAHSRVLWQMCEAVGEQSHHSFSEANKSAEKFSGDRKMQNICQTVRKKVCRRTWCFGAFRRDYYVYRLQKTFKYCSNVDFFRLMPHHEYIRIQCYLSGNLFMGKYRKWLRSFKWIPRAPFLQIKIGNILCLVYLPWK